MAAVESVVPFITSEEKTLKDKDSKLALNLFALASILSAYFENFSSAVPAEFADNSVYCLTLS